MLFKPAGGPLGVHAVPVHGVVEPAAQALSTRQRNMRTHGPTPPWPAAPDPWASPWASHAWERQRTSPCAAPAAGGGGPQATRPGFWLGRYRYLTVYQLCVFLNGPVCNGHSTFGAALRLEAQLETSPLGLAPM